MPSGKTQQSVMEKNYIYPREIQAYSEFLLEAEKLLISVGDSTKLGPKCLHTSLDPKPYLIFEDMKSTGYKPFPRNHVLNFDQAKPIVEKLAKLHAVSAVLVEKNPSIMKLYSEGSISTNPDRQEFLVHYENCARTLGLVVEKEWTDDWKEIAAKLKNFSKKIISKSCDLYLRDENAFNVFNHNDLWIPNVLFKFADDGSVEDILFIDFQLSYYGNPGIDLNFFFYGSLSKETRMNSTKKLVRIYHEILSETLKKLNYSKPIPTLHEIHVAILKTGLNGVLAAFAEVPLLIIEQSDNLRMDLLLAKSDEAEKFRFTLFQNPKYKTFIQNLLIEFDDLGYFE
jgi:thiamine kinase-like enzyme